MSGAEIPEKLQSVLDAQIRKGRVFSIVAKVQSVDGAIDFAGAAGTADPEGRVAMTADAPYFLASVTKMYTAAVAMMLHEEKMLDLDAPVSAYLASSVTRGLHVYKGRDYSEEIKVGQLVNQTSGLADYESGKPRGGRSVMAELKEGRDRPVDTSEALDIVRTLSPRFAPGTPGKAHYSNTNYRLLGAVIESATGKSIPANFEERIYRPLGLQNTYSFDPDRPQGRSPAAIYLKKAPANVPRYLGSNVPDGGLASTASESLAFLRAFFEGRLFDPSLLEKMMTWASMFFPLQYGYGLMHFRLPRFFRPRRLPEFIGHSGSTGSFAFLCPSRSLYLAGTVNQTDSPSRPFFLMIALADAAA